MRVESCTFGTIKNLSIRATGMSKFDDLICHGYDVYDYMTSNDINVSSNTDKYIK